MLMGIMIDFMSKSNFMNPSPMKPRIESIDFLRGLVMVLMVLDHTRDFFSNAPFSPTDLQHTSVLLFFTRWVTHFSAPVFILLIGVSMALAFQQGKSKKELSVFLITRGIWMMIAEVTLIYFVWKFSFYSGAYAIDTFTVIGMSMITLGCAIFLPRSLLLLISLLVIGGHNWLDGREVQVLGTLSWLHALGPHTFTFPLNFSIIVYYAFIPWLVVPMLGYAIGGLYALDVDKRRFWLYTLGLSMVLLFVVLRYSNVYGEPYLWSKQLNLTFTLLSFLNCTKYPPSLLFFIMIFGPTLILMAFADQANNRFVRLIATYGKVPFAFYLAHILVLHLLALGNAYLVTGSIDGLIGESVIGGKAALLNGYGLPMVYVIWLCVLFLLFPFCKWYGHYKRRHRDCWWLSYL
jgi:uncharacterized membrane protein